LQALDGTMEAVPLKVDLSAAAGEPFLVFKASEAPWVKKRESKPGELATYVGILAAARS